MKVIFVIVLNVLFLTLSLSAEQAEVKKVPEKKMVLTKFQKRAIKIKQMNDAAAQEEKQLEEDGFCPCSVQKP